MNTTICGVDDRILYVVIVWMLISCASRLYDSYTASQLRKRLERQATRTVDVTTFGDSIRTKGSST